MSQVMKTFTGLFMVLLMGAVAGGMLSMLLTVIEAQNLQSSIRFRLSCGCFAPQVLEECFADAEAAGDQLEVILYTEEGNAIFVKRRDAVPQDCSNVRGARVLLTFIVRAAIPAIEQEQTLSSYIR